MISEESIQELLNRLYLMQFQVSELEAEKQSALDKVIPQSVKDDIVDVEAEFNQKINAAIGVINKLEDAIKAQALEHSKTITGKHWQAVYNAGKVTWDTKKMEGYAAAHPDILALKTVGKPYIVIRPANKGGSDGKVR